MILQRSRLSPRRMIPRLCPRDGTRRLMYKNLTASNRLIKTVAMETARKNLKALKDRGEFVSLLREDGEIAYDVLEAVLSDSALPTLKRSQLGPCRACDAREKGVVSRGVYHTFEVTCPDRTCMCQFSGDAYVAQENATIHITSQKIWCVGDSVPTCIEQNKADILTMEMYVSSC